MYEQLIKRELVLQGSSESDSRGCMAWAIGDNYARVPLREMDDLFREKHPDCEVIYGSTDIRDGAKIMVKEYLKGV